jgi:hypothetical protein
MTSSDEMTTDPTPENYTPAEAARPQRFLHVTSRLRRALAHGRIAERQRD